MYKRKQQQSRATIKVLWLLPCIGQKVLMCNIISLENNIENKVVELEFCPTQYIVANIIKIFSKCYAWNIEWNNGVGV